MSLVDGGSVIVRLNTARADAPGGTFYTLAQLQSAGRELNGVLADPMFTVDQAAIDSDPTGFIPRPGSLAIDAGTTAGFTTDYLDRPLTAGPPDIGAFEVQ